MVIRRDLQVLLHGQLVLNTGAGTVDIGSNAEQRLPDPGGKLKQQVGIGDLPKDMETPVVKKTERRKVLERQGDTQKKCQESPRNPIDSGN